MAIIYPNTTNAGTATRTQYTFPATIGTTFPITISGSTASTKIATLFVPPEYLYLTSGNYYVSVVGYITSSTSGSTITGSVVIDPGDPNEGYFNYEAQLKVFNNYPSARAIKFLSASSDVEFNFQFSGVRGYEVPIHFSGSTSDYTASIYGFYFSPIS